MNQLHLFEDPEASSLKNFTIYRSSAGSGKTFTLVKEYLLIVLRNPQDYQHILAITFTNKATEEMKTRILQYLMDMAAGKDTPMKKVIEEEVKDYPQALNIQDRAKKALTNILHNYSRFSISTIDHFFSQLVRSLARELKLSLNYEIDVDDDTAMVESLHLLYENLTHNTELRNWTRDFAFSRIEDDKGWQLDYTLIDFGKELFKEKFHEGFSKINKEDVNIQSLRALEEQLKNTQRQYRSHQKKLARQALELIRQHGLTMEDFKRKRSGPVNTFHKILKNDLALNPTFQKTARGEDDWYTGGSLKQKEVKGVVEAGLGQLAREIYEYHLAHYHEYVTSRQLQRHIYSYGLLEAISEQLKVYRQSNNLMLLSHNSFLLRDVISDREAPFLFEKLGNYYHHVLIDEFQDTSTYQWENIKPLITNALDQRNHVLLVGDVKQSIYRWRGGDLNLLLNKAMEDLSLYRDQLQEKTLQHNRRSAETIVTFNNQFFKLASQSLLLTKGLPEDPRMLIEVYREVEQQFESKVQGGVSIKFLDRNDGQWTHDAMDDIIGLIRDHLAQQGRCSDFLILCNRNVEVAQMSQHLSLLGIPVDSEQALNLAGYWAVRLVISAMYLLLDARDQLARAEMAYLYQKGRKHSSVDFNQLFLESCQLNSGLLEEYLPASLVSQWPDLLHLNIYEWVSQVIPLLVDSTEADPFLTRFLDISLEQNAKGNTTARDFLDWWEGNKHDQMVIFPSHQDAVRIMTIHKAKGLEAPIVILPRADFELKPRKDSLFWTDQLSEPYTKYKLLPLSYTSDLLESHFADAYQKELIEGLTEGLNTIYVAFTRARQRLYVYSVKPSSGKVADDDLSLLYKLLWQVCNHPDWGSNWNPQTNTFIMGDITEPIVNLDSGTLPSIPIDRLRIQPYENKVGVQSGSHRMFTLLDNYKAANIREGLQLHTTLERLRDKEDLKMVLDQMQAEGLLKEKDKPQIKVRVNALFSQPVFSSFFDKHWEVFSEREIASEGKWYKPDRVIIKDNQAIVVDYKREKEDPKHHQQVSHYARLLEKMGYQRIKKFLVYVSDSKIVEV
jgi:ATP-dependent exoDNAse (exonuclease V) beta subunit